MNKQYTMIDLNTGEVFDINFILINGIITYVPFEGFIYSKLSIYKLNRNQGLHQRSRIVTIIPTIKVNFNVISNE